jgi:hypothetical protein
MLRDLLTGAKDQLHCFECISLYERGSFSLIRGHRRKTNDFARHKVMKSHNWIFRFQAA